METEIFDKKNIKKIIPHRHPMLLVDKIEKIDENTCSGYYKVKGTEFFLRGHFPENPIVPGVILCEMMAQSSCVLLDLDGATPYFTTLKNVKFKGMVKPEDTIRFECTLTRKNGVFYFMTGSGYVGDKLCVSAEISCAVIKNKNG